MPHLLEIHFRKLIKYYEKKQEIKKQQLEKKKEIHNVIENKINNVIDNKINNDIDMNYDNDDLHFEDFFYENLTIFF